MSLPNFLLVGASQSGSSWLWNALRDHPDVFMPRPKEPNYFAYEGREPPLAGPGDAERGARFVRRWSDYERLFDEAKEERAVGEASVHCLYWSGSAARIAARLGRHVRILVTLRDPVSKAHSTWVRNRALGVEPLDSFRDALAAETGRIERGWACWWHYRARSYYHVKLREFYDVFGAERVGVVLFDELAPDPAATARELYAFLGVSPVWTPANHGHRGSGRVKPPLDPDVVADLRAGYRDDIARTASLIGRDLSAWSAEGSA